jgi:hypothetical protein
VKGRLRDAAQFGDRFRLPIDFEEIIYRHPETTGLYRLTYTPANQAVDSEEHKAGIIAAQVTVDVTEPTEPLAKTVERALQAEIGPNITVTLTKPGGATPELVNQKMYSAVRTVKSASFDDKRPTEWLVTY